MSSGLGKWRRRTLAGIFATPVALSVVQQNNMVNADESMTWWLTKNVLRFAGVAVITYAAKKIFGSKNKCEAKAEISEKAIRRDKNSNKKANVIEELSHNAKKNKNANYFNKLFFSEKNKNNKQRGKDYKFSKNTITFENLFGKNKKKKEEKGKKLLYEGFLMKEKFCEIVGKELNKNNLNFTKSEINYFREIIKDIRNIKEKFGNMEKYHEDLKEQKNNVPLLCSDLFFVVNKDGSFEAFYYDEKDEKQVLIFHKNSPIRKLIEAEFKDMKEKGTDKNVYNNEKGILISKVKTKAEKDEMEKELKELSYDRSAENSAELKKSEEELSKEVKDLESELDNEEAMKQEELNKKISEDYEKLGKEVYQEEIKKFKEYENRINSGIKDADDLLKSTENKLDEAEKGFNKAYEDFSNDFEILRNQ